MWPRIRRSPVGTRRATVMNTERKAQAPQGWERAKVIATIIDAVARLADLVLHR